MSTVQDDTVPSRAQRLRAVFRRYLNLRQGQADYDVIDEDIRAGAELRGSTAWILIAAILIASIGLDVNSTAVIIGAMLISPLMGPIMGLGYGIGIYDFALIRKSLRRLAIATLLSLATSTLYFSLSPLTGEQSELLARTSPSIWDVLIALFGGIAGMVGATRKEKTNVIPGVAIATALMPPLCTAGYGLAHGNPRFFAGAFYLFSINSVFIAFATMFVTWMIRARPHTQVDPRTQRRVRHTVLGAVLLTAIPSVYLAYRLVGDEIFLARAQTYIKDELTLPYTVVAQTHIDPTKRIIDVTVVGQHADRGVLDALERKLPSHGLAHTQLVVRQAGEQIDRGQLESSLKASIVNDLLSSGQSARRALDDKDQTIADLRTQLEHEQVRRDGLAAVVRELYAQYPEITRVTYADANRWEAGASAPDAETETVFDVSARKPLTRAERQRIERWLKVRLGSTRVRLLVAG